MDRFAHLQWPFFDAKHQKLAREADAWAAANLGYSHGEDADAICKRLVQDLGCAGYLHHSATEKPDVRSIALLREVFAYHSGLADFSFVMQGLGSGPMISCTSPPEQKLPPAPVTTMLLIFFSVLKPMKKSLSSA